jgi:hypothetical protein
LFSIPGANKLPGGHPPGNLPNNPLGGAGGQGHIVHPVNPFGGGNQGPIQLVPVGMYVEVEKSGNEYIVKWEDNPKEVDPQTPPPDYDDVILSFEVERLPFYRRAAGVVIPETATAHNTYAFQVGNAVIEAWYEYDPNTEKPTKLWLKTTALADLPGEYKFKLTGPNGEDLPNVGNNPFTLRALRGGETDIQYFAPVTGSVKLTVTAPARGTTTVSAPPDVATIEKRTVVGYSTKTIRFGDTASTYCSKLDLNGHKDWRLPSKNELLSNVIIANKNDGINYWSLTSSANEAYTAWYVNVSNGDSSRSFKNNNLNVKCVRSIK